MTDWIVKGRELGNCNCEAAVGFQFDEGRYGDVDLSGLRAAGVYAWPKAVHEGDGIMQLIIDESANEAQRHALITIMTGKDTEPMTTMWSVFTTMCSTILDPLFKPITVEIDVEGRTGRVEVPSVLEITGEPIRNPVTGQPHRARIDLPHSFEYEIAEIGSGTTRATGKLKIAHEKSYAQFAELHLSNKGVVRSRAAA